MPKSQPNDAAPVSILLAKWIAPMDGPVIRDGGIAIARGRTLAVATASDIRATHPHATIENLGDVLLLPGLINAHVHLELSALSPGERPMSFVPWLKRLLPPTPPSPEAAKAFAQRGIAIGVEQCLRFGVTAVGDISRQCAITRPLLQSAPLRTVSFGEVQAMAQRRGLLDERVAIAADRHDASERVRIGISPHAPYSVERGGYERCLQVAREHQLPLATHLAETADESPFLAEHAGPFRALWDYLGAWDDHVPTFVGGPMRFAKEIGLLDFPTLLAHVNYCDDAELAMLAAGRASVAYCPRTHAYFGHPPHRWREMLAAGINVAIGTDSCASSPNLNLVDDLRLLHRIAPEVPVQSVWHMATIRAARAIGWENEIGSLAPGKYADLVTFESPRNDDPLMGVLQSQAIPTAVWLGGKKMIGSSRAGQSS